jgi:branched-chain amino acid transport system permease protein
MALLPELLLQILYAVSCLILTSIGLAVTFGMMRVVNFAHGEFLMLGGFVMVFAVRAGINFWVAMFVVAPLALAAFGLVVERLLIRPLYGRILDSILATWGLSLALIGLTSTFFGYNQKGLSPPLGSFELSGRGQSYYSVFIIVITIAVVTTLYVVLRKTTFGLLARGTMQNADMASAIGINPHHIYATTFALGAGLAGFAGAVMVPLTGVVPITGLTYITQAFITVITGGANALAGTVAAASLFGLIGQTVTVFGNAVFGQAIVLATAIVLLRLMPGGITGRFFQRSL